MNGTQQPPLGALIWAIYFDDPRYTATVFLGTMAFVAAIFALNWPVHRWRVKRMLRRLVMERPDVDRSDPKLSHTAHVTFDAEGAESRSATGTTRINWIMMSFWQEEDGRIFLLGPKMSGFCLTISTIPPAVLAEIRALLTAKYGPPRRR